MHRDREFAKWYRKEGGDFAPSQAQAIWNSAWEASIEAMADGEGKFAAQKEISAAQDSMLAGKMGACAAHLGKAMHAGSAK